MDYPFHPVWRLACVVACGECVVCPRRAWIGWNALDAILCDLGACSVTREVDAVILVWIGVSAMIALWRGHELRPDCLLSWEAFSASAGIYGVKSTCATVWEDAWPISDPLPTWWDTPSRPGGFSGLIPQRSCKATSRPPPLSVSRRRRPQRPGDGTENQHKQATFNFAHCNSRQLLNPRS